jgi:hypothetical protein
MLGAELVAGITGDTAQVLTFTDWKAYRDILGSRVLECLPESHYYYAIDCPRIHYIDMMNRSSTG